MRFSPSKSRVWLEAPIIVVSILLAFGIEAGWAGLMEAREGRPSAGLEISSWNLVTLRLESEVSVQSRLDRLDDMADELLLVLPEGR